MACFVYPTKSCPCGRLTLVVLDDGPTGGCSHVAGLFLLQSAVAIVRHLASLLLAFFFSKRSKKLALLRNNFESLSKSVL
eukprot:6245983-Ditylum_brightwellii.AAC.1